MAWSGSLQRPREMRLSDKVWQSNWGMIFVIALISSFGFAMLYSAANGSWDPWASRQVVRFAVGLVMLFCVAFIDIRHWFRYAYLFYFLALGLLVAVEVMVQRYFNNDRAIRALLTCLLLASLFPLATSGFQILTGFSWKEAQAEGLVRVIGMYHDAVTMKSNTFPSNFQRVSINDSCWS